ncbi:hypothetical protein LFAB_08330 [Lactiplantibacillus fabifermentans T30PCM01]|uniref:Transcriptional regulator TetR C-terminal Firmicutes type domain-containing protein n=1 Tax=Lactiplantibacillus fabifermentans T30PCM01 TaxID=1400520 RepID=W6T7M2_9LACO|nr:TetR-like C-terminal domain-containing protein [Lactiplantibacillus fabifermentans]ETY74277.1 hypothetical protein LFAB_08330 [Lactiplantibacillus fabifermentans T30PCM01]
MFHVKRDKRSQASAALVVSGLYQCLEEKAFDKITIADIQSVSSVGRATFYRLFDRLSDVLAYECNNVIDHFVQSNALINANDQFTVFFTDWMTHDVLLETLMTSGNSELLYFAFREHADELGRLLSPKVELSSYELDFFINIATSALIASLDTWVKHDRQETPNQLATMMRVTLRTVNESLNG